MKKYLKEFAMTLHVQRYMPGTCSIRVLRCTIAGRHTTAEAVKPFSSEKTWAGYTCDFEGVDVPGTEEEIQAHREMALSYAVYRIMAHRFGSTPDAEITMFNINSRMAMLGYDVTITSTDYMNDGAAALGNYVAEQIIAFGMQDGANEANEYASQCYEPINPNIQPEYPGNPTMVYPNHWQPIELTVFIDQSGNISTAIPEFVGPEWGGSDGIRIGFRGFGNLGTGQLHVSRLEKSWKSSLFGHHIGGGRFVRPVEMELRYGFRLVIPPGPYRWSDVGYFARKSWHRWGVCNQSRRLF